MSLAPVSRSSLSDAVYDQLVGEIVGGGLEAGAALLAERALVDQLQVNRGAVREALKRLSEAGLIETRHGGNSRVADYRTEAGLDLLPRLLLREEGIDAAVVRAMLEMRSCIGADAARLAALRGAPVDALEETVAALAEAGELKEAQVLAMVFWERLVELSANIAYRLATNGLRRTYEPVRVLLAEALAPELREIAGYEAIIAAIRAREPEAARLAALDLLGLGEAGVLRLVTALGGGPS